MGLLVKEDLERLGGFLKRELGKELVLQKHRASGRLIDTMFFKVVQKREALELQIWAQDYAKTVEKGQRPGIKVPIEDLIEWIKAKGIERGDKQIKTAAFLIQRAIIKQGIPTAGSKRLAPRRTGFIEHVFDAQQEEITTRLQNAAFADVEATITNLIRKTQRQIEFK